MILTVYCYICSGPVKIVEREHLKGTPRLLKLYSGKGEIMVKKSHL